MKAILLALKTPWIASPRSSRWLALFVVAVCTVSAVLAAHGLQGRARLVTCGALWCVAVGVWWLMVAINALFMARDAIALRLPRIRRAANASAALYALLAVPLPAVAFALMLGHLFAWLVCFTLAVAASVLFLLLPGWLCIALLIGQGLLFNTHWLHLKVPRLHALPFDALLPTLVLVALAAWRWFRVQRQAMPGALAFGNPVIWNLRFQSMQGFLGLRGRRADTMLARSTRGWFAPEVNLRGLGPGRPARSIRVALGRSVMPKTSASWLRQWCLSLAFIALFTLPEFVQMGNHDFRAIMAAMVLPQHGGFGFPMVVAAVMAAIATLGFAIPIQSRWTTAAAELPMLAQLPGLGDARRVKQHVAQACLSQTLFAGAIEFVALCALGVWAHVMAGAALFACLCALCTIALAAACIFGILGGRPLSWWTTAVLTMLLVCLCVAAMWAAFSRAGFNAHAWLPLIAALLLMLGVLAALALRGWRALERRPHPFLAN